MKPQGRNNMCQMSIVLEKNDQREKIMDNVNLLEVTADGIKVSTLFEEAKILPNTEIIRIDFLDGIVTLKNTIQGA
jgi:predicted RNA-binding protein